MDLASLVNSSLATIANAETQRSEDVQHANDVLREISKDPQFLGLMLRHLSENPDPSVRNLSTVLMRRKLPKAWSLLADNEKAVFATELLRRLETEPVHDVRLSVAHCVSAVAKIQFDAWRQQLMTIVSGSLLSAENTQAREVGITVLQGIFEQLSADEAKPYFKETARACLWGLQSDSDRLKVASVKLVECLASYVESDTGEQAALHELIPPLIKVAKDSVGEGSDTLQYIMELLVSLIEVNVVGADHVADVLTLVLVIIKSEEEAGVKLQAVCVLRLLCKKRPKPVVAIAGAVDSLFDALLVYGSQPSDADEDDPTEAHPWVVAGEALDAMCTLLPLKFVYEPVMKRLNVLRASSNPMEVRMSLYGLGAIAEGSRFQMVKSLPAIVPSILESAQSSDRRVRSAACLAISQMSVYLQPEISLFGLEAFKVLMTCLRQECEQRSPTQESICSTLEIFLVGWEISTDPLVPLLDESFTLFATVLQNNSENEAGIRVVDSVLGAIGALAAACKQAIVPFLPHIVEMLQQRARSPHASTRTKAVSAMTLIVSSMSKEEYLPYQAHFQDPILDLLRNLAPQDFSESLEQADESMERHEARESCYTFLEVLSKVLGDDFGPLVRHVGPWLLASALSGDGVMPVFKDEVKHLQELDDGDAVEDMRDIASYVINKSALEEQQAAMSCLAAIFANVSMAHTEILLQRTFDAIESLAQIFDPEIRKSVAKLASSVVISVHKAYPPAWLPREVLQNPEALSSVGLRMWRPGISPCVSPLSEQCRNVWCSKAWPVFDNMLKEESDKEALGDILMNLHDLLTSLGPGLICDESILTSIGRVIGEILGNTHVSQAGSDEVALDDEEDFRAVEECFYVETSNLLAALCQVVGPRFESFFAQINDKILALARNKSLSYVGIGAYAEVVRYMGPASFKYIEPVVPIALADLSGEEAAGRRNAFYFFGNLADQAKQQPAVGPALDQAVLITVRYLEENFKGELNLEDVAVVDNAVSCLGRIFLALPADRAPVDAIVPAFLSAVPLKEDFEETLPVISVLKTLLMWPNFAQVEGHLQGIIKACILCIVHPDMPKHAPAEDWNSLQVIMRTVLQRLGFNSAVVQGLVKDMDIAGSAKARAVLETAF